MGGQKGILRDIRKLYPTLGSTRHSTEAQHSVWADIPKYWAPDIKEA